MPDDTKRWTIEIDKPRFDKLKSEERFWQLVTLSRAINALRFVHAALLAHPADDDSLRAMRTRYNSFFYNCALLYEALLLVERLAKHFRDVPEFTPLREILKDRTATEIRNFNLNPLRNQVTFRFSEDAIGGQLMKMDMQPRFVSGQGTTNENVYNELADLCTLGIFSGLPMNDAEALEKLGEQIQTTTDPCSSIHGRG
jgi:hypothetical protein